jgi:hypothetical protein
MPGKSLPVKLTDKTALAFLLMLSDPERKWHVHDFHRVGISMGRASEILTNLMPASFVEREYKGRFSYTALVSPQRLIGLWAEGYSFVMNRRINFRGSEDALTALKKAFEAEEMPPYALTVHTGANLIAPYVKSSSVHAYLDPKGLQKTLSYLVKGLDLKQVMDNGNVFFYEPVHEEATFFNTQAIRGHRVVSNLQLYLDLIHFGSKGYEHAMHLKRTLEERGMNLW